MPFFQVTKHQGCTSTSACENVFVSRFSQVRCHMRSCRAATFAQVLLASFLKTLLVVRPMKLTDAIPNVGVMVANYTSAKHMATVFHSVKNRKAAAAASAAV